MLTPFQRTAHLVVFRSQFIFAGRDPKNLTTAATVENSTLPLVQCQFPIDSFKILQILRTISSGLDVIHTPASFPVGVYYDNGDCHIFCVKLYPMTMHLD